MSAALQLPMLWGTSGPAPAWQADERRRESLPPGQIEAGAAPQPVVSLGFYRRHTESLLRRFLYASMQVGRAPSILGDPVGRGIGP